MEKTSNDYKTIILENYFDEDGDSGRFTSQDVCDNLKDTVALSVDEVTEFMLMKGYTLQRDGDRLVWAVL